MIERYVNCLKQEIIQYAQENKVMADHNLEPKYILKTIYIEEARLLQYQKNILLKF